MSLDGRSVGAVAPVDQLELHCPPGPHELRVRQWWMRSRATFVEVSTDDVTRVEVVDPSQQAFPGTFLNMLFLPWRSLRLSPAATSSSALSTSAPLPGEAAMVEREVLLHRLATQGIFQVLGFLLLALAVMHWNITMLISSVLIIGLSSVFALRLVMVARRDLGG